MSGSNRNTHATNARRNESEGIRRRALTKEKVFNSALARLGFPFMNVEVMPEQMEIFLELTFDIYNRYMPIEKFDVLDNVTSTINRYNLEELEKPFGRGVVDVRIGTKENFFSPISGVFALGIPHPISHLSPDQYDLALRYIKTARKVYSSAEDWEWEEPVLWLYAPTGFGGPFLVAYTYYAEASTPEDLPAVDWKWFQDYFYNMVRGAVGEGRFKFNGTPGGHQGSIQMNGSSMVQAADSEMKRLEEELVLRSYARTPPLGPGS